jgi:glutamate carboxypeptidase
MSRPPMQPTARTDALRALATEVGREIGIDADPIEKMGGSDGCFAPALGVPVLDAMGPLYHDSCGETERIELGSVVPRTAPIAGIVARLARM